MTKQLLACFVGVVILIWFLSLDILDIRITMFTNHVYKPEKYKFCLMNFAFLSILFSNVWEINLLCEHSFFFVYVSKHIYAQL